MAIVAPSASTWRRPSVGAADVTRPPPLDQPVEHLGDLVDAARPVGTGSALRVHDAAGFRADAAESPDGRDSPDDSSHEGLVPGHRDPVVDDVTEAGHRRRDDGSTRRLVLVEP